MDVLLANLVAREPGEMVPVLTLPLQLAESFLVAAVPDTTAVPVALAAYQFADSAVMDTITRVSGG